MLRVRTPACFLRIGQFIPTEHLIAVLPNAPTPPLPRFQELEKLGLGDSVDLHVYEIPVEYKTVQRLIPALWEKHSPQVSRAKAAASLSGPEMGAHPGVIYGALFLL